MSSLANEPAFPFFNDENLYPGITKREYFAAMAMQGLISAGKENFIINGNKMNLDTSSFYIADAMIAESEKNVLT